MEHTEESIVAEVDGFDVCKKMKSMWVAAQANMPGSVMCPPGTEGCVKMGSGTLVPLDFDLRLFNTCVPEQAALSFERKDDTYSVIVQVGFIPAAGA